MPTVKMVVNANDKRSVIAPEIYGHFSEHLGKCIYGGIFVGEDSSIPNTNGIRNDVIAAFKQIKMPLLRWPGGCFADDYHWQDGVGERKSRPARINRYWGWDTEDNSFGTHEFFKLCELVGCEPYLAGNLGSGGIKELSDWLEYITFDGNSTLANERRKNGREKAWHLKYLGIGNENWGGGGSMRPEYYTDEYRRYQSYCTSFSEEPLYRIASGANVDDYNWTEKFMANISDCHAEALSLHYYVLPTGKWEKKGDAVRFDDSEYYNTIKGAYYMDELITRHGNIIKHHSKKIKLAVDEWGNWCDVEEGTKEGHLYQQNTMRDAITSAINLNIFNSHSDIVCMANLAQAVNVLQSLLLIDGEQLAKTPTYHVFDMFKGHQGGTLVYSHCENFEHDSIPMISQSVSIKDNKMTITLANASLDSEFEVNANIIDFAGANVKSCKITGDAHSHNTFESPCNVDITEHSATLCDSKLKVILPPCSVALVEIA